MVTSAPAMLTISSPLHEANMCFARWQHWARVVNLTRVKGADVVESVLSPIVMLPSRLTVLKKRSMKTPGLPIYCNCLGKVGGERCVHEATFLATHCQQAGR